MGSGASTQVPEGNGEMFKKLKDQYDQKYAEVEGMDDESKNQELFSHMKQQFLTLTARSDTPDMAESKTSSGRKPMKGDVVELKNGEGNRIEGVILETNDGVYQIEIDGGIIVDGAKESDFTQIHTWDTLEPTDIVKVKEENGYRYFEAEVVKLHADGTVQVQYAEDEFEDGICQTRIMKIVSGRSVRAYSKWETARKIIAATKFFSHIQNVEVLQ